MNEKVLHFVFSYHIIIPLILFSGTTSAIVIDDFSGDTFSGSAPLSGEDAGSSSGGFQRTVDASATVSGTGSGELSIQLNGVVLGERYDHHKIGDINSDVFGISTVHYALGGLDLTVGADALGIDIFRSREGMILSILLEDSTGRNVSNALTLPAVSPIGLTPFAFSFTGFFGDAGFNFADVATASIRVDGSGVADGFVTSDNFQTVCINCERVPAPATLAVFSLGLAGLGYQRHNQNKTA